MKLQLVPLEPDDWKRYSNIRIRALTADPQAFYSTAGEAALFTEKDWRKRLSAPDSATFVLTDEDQTDHGLAGALPYSEDDAEDGDHQLVAMWVAPEARGSGAAHMLVEAAIIHARNMGARRLVLWVAWGNIKAEALYRAHGFRRTGQTGSFPPPRDTPEFQMALKL